MDNIRENPDKPWKWDYIAMNPNITNEFIQDNYHNISFQLGIRNLLSGNENITLSIIEDNPYIYWHWNVLRTFKNILQCDHDTLQNLVTLCEDAFKFQKMTKCKTGQIWEWDHNSRIIDLDYIMENLDDPWDFEIIFSRSFDDECSELAEKLHRFEIINFRKEFRKTHLNF